MNLLYPKLKPSQLPAMFGIALLGGLIGGIYGIFHDLFTYSISHEYYTRLKFGQFAHADFGVPPRVFAAEIGFIAASAVGLAAGWFLARTAIPAWPRRVAFRKILGAFLRMLVIALAAAAVGYVLGLHHDSGASPWQEYCVSLGVTDVHAFVRVAYIHNAGYLGSFLGLILAILNLRSAIRQPTPSMKTRIVEAEILDHLPHEDAAARRSRADLRRINFLMGNDRWVLRNLRRFPEAISRGICEFGAGDGALVAEIARRFPDSQVTACDLAPRPVGLDARIDWCCGDVFQQTPESGGVLLANLFLHHFEGEDLRRLGQICEGFEALVFNEPDRTRLAAFLGTLLHPFVNHVTRNDMRISIRAGFRPGEIARLMRLDPARWRIEETSTWRGARRVIACRV